MCLIKNIASKIMSLLLKLSITGVIFIVLRSLAKALRHVSYIQRHNYGIKYSNLENEVPNNSETSRVAQTSFIYYYR